MKDAIHSLVAKVTIWSMRAALKGKWPTQGPFGESLLGARSQKAGLEFGNGYRLAYHGFKADAKAKKECRVFERSYMHNKVCEACMAEKPTSKNHDSLLTYKDFYPNAAHLLTELNHRDYLVSSTRISPWEPMPGFDFRTCFRDQCTQFFWGRQRNFWHLVWVIGVDVGVLRGPICKNNCDGYHKDKKNVALKLDSDVHSKPSHLQTPG